MNNRTVVPRTSAVAGQGSCAAEGCSKPLPELAAKNQDVFCSRLCCEREHGVEMAADLQHGGEAPQDITKMRTLGGAAPATTRLMREAEARSLEAHARLAREAGSGRHARLEAGQ